MIAAEAAPAAVFGGCPRDFAGRRFALVSNLDLNLYKFRMPLFRALMERGAEVYAVAPAGDYAARLEAEGVRFAGLGRCGHDCEAGLCQALLAVPGAAHVVNHQPGNRLPWV